MWVQFLCISTMASIPCTTHLSVTFKCIHYPSSSNFNSQFLFAQKKVGVGQTLLELTIKKLVSSNRPSGGGTRRPGQPSPKSFEKIAFSKSKILSHPFYTFKFYLATLPGSSKFLKKSNLQGQKYYPSFSLPKFWKKSFERPKILSFIRPSNTFIPQIFF